MPGRPKADVGRGMREGPAVSNRPHEVAGQWMQSRRPTLRPDGRRRQRQRLERIDVVSQPVRAARRASVTIEASPAPRGGGQAFRAISDRLVFRPRLAPVA